jgi:hypothetical protein
VLDALKEGLKVFILTDDIAGVNKQQQESSIALEEMVNSALKKQHPKICWINLPLLRLQND